MKYLLLILLVGCTTVSNIIERKSTTTITLNASKSFDPDGWIVSYNWQQITGVRVQIINPDSVIAQAAISTPGIYVFQVTGIDNEGAKGTKTVTKTVKKK